MLVIANKLHQIRCKRLSLLFGSGDLLPRPMRSGQDLALLVMHSLTKAA
jgi:hypothetical protein